MTNDMPILIVGAGPTGLMLAAELARQGADCRIVDKSTAPTMLSRAIALQTRTLEFFDQRGIIAEVVRLGQKVHGLSLRDGDRRIARIALDQVASEYPFIIDLAQNETERILTEHLEKYGIHVERAVELIDFTQDDAAVTATLQHGDGRHETVVAPWIIGCDGAHSAVRHALQIPFTGGDYPETWTLADVQLTWNLPDDEMQIFPHPHGILATFPLGQGRQRIFVELHGVATPSEPTLADFQHYVAERGPRSAATLSDPRWMANFRLHLRHAERYRQGRALLAGDAAHIHSPAGGQGMNTGLGDAINLSWKLALVQRGLAHPSLITSYEAERAPVAAGVMRLSDTLLRVTAVRNPVLRGLRNRLAPLVTAEPMIQRALTRRVSELAVSYRASAIVGAHGNGAGPHAGDRAPDAALLAASGHPTRIFDLLRGPQHVLLLAVDDAATPQTWHRLVAFATDIAQRYAGLIAPYLIAKAPALTDVGTDVTLLRDSESAFQRAYAATDENLYLIRPDGYVGYRCHSIDNAALAIHLRQIFR